jgi:hypothetical protein
MKKMRPARLRKSTTVFLVGNIEATMDWYRGHNTPKPG